ncbi:fatty acyl-CoA synthetase [Jatrophihabitans sp. YIM 134969]
MDVTSSTVDDVVRRSAGRHPARTALTFRAGPGVERSWTYAELDDAVTRTAVWLLGQGLSPGDRVATYGRNSDAYLLAYLGCARAGLVHVPINYALFGEELRYLVEDCGASLVLADPDLRETVAPVVPPATPLLGLHGDDDALLAHASTGDVDAPDVEVRETDVVQLLYTSGTTSRPKGAIMTHRALLHEYVSSIVAMSLHEDDVPLHPMPLYHSAQMHVFLLPYLMVGAENHLMPAPDVPEILRRVEADGIHQLFLAPTVWVPLTNHPDFATRDLSGLRKACYGASIMPATTVHRLQERCPDAGLYNCFGQSEIGPLATVLQPAEHTDRPASCGREVLFVETRIVDEDGAEVGPGTAGELLYRSPQLCQGYWNKPEETEAAFRDGWFHSGDMVVKDAEGYVTVVDRIKDVINTGGVLVASREVEDALYTHPAVAEVAVIGTPHERWIEAVTAFVVLRDGQTADEDALIEHTRSRLAAFKRPKRVLFVEELPRNGSGKLLKRVLRTDPRVTAAG